MDGIPKTCFEEKTLPSADSLRNRMKFVSAFLDLDASFSNECVTLLGLALDAYLKNVMSQMIKNNRTQTTADPINIEHFRFSMEATEAKVDPDIIESCIE